MVGFVIGQSFVNSSVLGGFSVCVGVWNLLILVFRYVSD